MNSKKITLFQIRSKLPNILEQIFLYIVSLYFMWSSYLPNQRRRTIFCITLNIHSHQYYLVTKKIYNNDSLRIVVEKDHKYTWSNNAAFNGVLYRKAKETMNRGTQIFPDKGNRCRNQVTGASFEFRVFMKELKEEVEVGKWRNVVLGWNYTDIGSELSFMGKFRITLF